MPIEIHGKQYILVNERLQAFNETYKNGSIKTIMDYDGEIVRCTAIVTPDASMPDRIFTGHAEELRGSTNINKTSAVENCETSAVGRALAMLGIGIIDSVASADEVIIAQNKTKAPATPAKAETSKKICSHCKKAHTGPYPKCLECWKSERSEITPTIKGNAVPDEIKLEDIPF